MYSVEQLSSWKLSNWKNEVKQSEQRRIGRSPKMSDARVLETVNEWMRSRLHCAAGRREHNKGRYMIEIASEKSVCDIRQRFQKRLESDNATACLFVFNEPAHYSGRSNVAEAFAYLAFQMASLSDLTPCALQNGAPLSSSMELVCPVTDQVTVFDDFECIAFCPQSNDIHDPLYDPLLFAPVTVVNMSSDVYAFSRFVADSAEIALGRPVYRESDQEVRSVFLRKCVERWHRIAVSIIEAFERNTDKRQCPVHVANDGKHWIAAHKDPAFAETRKEVHRHELPVIYAERIVSRWLAFFDESKPYKANGLARDGIRIKEA